jgi:hypothetical protein
VINVCDCFGKIVRRNVPTLALTMAGGLTSTDPSHKLNLDNIRDGHIKFTNLKKDKLKELCATFFDHIENL